jgi:2-amino-4-hydroxy-6-hydroxymethyldihydropteridine diphosphokinase
MKSNEMTKRHQNEQDGQAEVAPMRNVYLGLGSNLGDRDANLRAAISKLAEFLHVERVSSVYETEPLLVEDQPLFHNLVCAGQTPLDPFSLLRALKRIESDLGRVSGPRYGPRVIDIDILLFDDLVQTTPELTIPHPAMLERAFVLIPLAEIAPYQRHPVAGRTIEELARSLDASGVRRQGVL